MKEADRILQEIIDTVKSWEDTEDIWTPTEWQKSNGNSETCPS
jgi:hypothetical protein